MAQKTATEKTKTIMKRVLLNILQMLDPQSSFLAEIAANASTLKSVICILEARAQTLLEKQVATEPDKVPKHIVDRSKL